MKQRQLNLFAFCAPLVIVGMAAMTANATERTWVGASGGSWYVAENWDPSGVPGEKDTVIFRPDSELTVAISGHQTQCRAGEIRFESGKTTFAYDSSSLGIYMGYMGNSTNVLYVAGDAEAVVSNRFFTTNNTRRFRKTGGGKLTIVPQTNDFWSYSSSNAFAGCDFADGETVLAAGSGNYPLANFLLHVCSGAVVRCAASYRTKTSQPLEVDYGGVLDCGGKAQYAKSVTGDGVVSNHYGFTIYLTGGVCTFAGQFIKWGTGPTVNFNTRPSGMSDEDWGFVIGASNTFAKSRLSQPSGTGDTIRFAPGIGDFWIKELIGSTGQYLTLEDTNGDPVTVRGGFYNSSSSPVPRFKGSGNFLCTMSAYIRSSDVVANMTGALGACSGATLTIGNDTAETWPDISGLGGFIVEDGTVALKNKNADDAVVGGTTIFRTSSCRLTATAGLEFCEGSTVRFEIPESGLAAGVTPISAPTISFGATTRLEADVAAYRARRKKKSQITFATASTSLVVPDAVIAASNARADGYRFVKSGNSLILEVAGTGGFIITFR